MSNSVGLLHSMLLERIVRYQMMRYAILRGSVSPCSSLAYAELFSSLSD